jgi:hypothetical protein
MNNKFTQTELAQMEGILRQQQPDLFSHQKVEQPVAPMNYRDKWQTKTRLMGFSEDQIKYATGK